MDDMVRKGVHIFSTKNKGSPKDNLKDPHNITLNFPSGELRGSPIDFLLCCYVTLLATPVRQFRDLLIDYNACYLSTGIRKVT